MGTYGRLVLVVVLGVAAATIPSCGCGYYASLVPAEKSADRRCQIYRDGEAHRQMVVGEQRTYDVVSSTDTGSVRINIDSAESSAPAVVEVVTTETVEEGGEAYSVVTLRAKKAGVARIRLAKDGESESEPIEVVESADELVRPGMEACLGVDPDAGQTADAGAADVLIDTSDAAPDK